MTQQTRIRIIKKSIPAVVSVSVFENIDTVKKESPFSLFSISERGRKRTQSNREKIIGGHLQIDGGSGFIADKNGIVVTNMHVVHRDHLNYTVTTADRKVHKAKLVGIDVVSDIAFLKITSTQTFPTLSLGDSSTLQLGQDVLAIGNAMGVFENTVSQGIISGLARSIDASNIAVKESLRGLIQTDAAINPGNSGGPLLDDKGKAIGISVATLSKADNISFAIPINTIKEDLSRIKKFGTLQKPFLGIRYVMLTPSIATRLSCPHKQGAIVLAPSPHQQAVLSGSPAHQAGIKDGDIILMAGEKHLTESYTLQDAMEEAGINKKITLTIMRDHAPKHISVFLQEGLSS